MNPQHMKRALRFCTAIATSDAADLPGHEDVLGTLLVDAVEGFVRFTATDGHRALRIGLKGNGPTTLHHVSVARVDEIERATRDAPDTPALVAVTLEGLRFDPMGLTLPTLSAEKFPSVKLAEHFASLTRKPQQRLSFVEWEIRPDYLHDLTTIVTKFSPSPRSRLWCFWPIDSGDAMGFKMTFDDVCVEYLLMPCTRDL